MLAVALAALLALSLTAAHAQTEPPRLPAVGETIEGFEVLSVSASASAQAVALEHVKTGAKVLYMANEDPNRVFAISFHTPAKDDTGLSHVFEHATLGGSEKYPSQSLMFNLAYQTYNTYMNAMTFDVMTCYPVASLSEEQLLRYADFYTDSVFHPRVLKDKRIFDSEAWRYTLSAPDGDLAITGNVYSEMTGSYTLQSAAQLNAYKTLFPGSAIANSYGGVPSRIPEMRWEDLKNYHQEFYHPSNSLTCLYGNFKDYRAFLRLLNGYFAGYEKKDFDWRDKGYTPIQAPQTATFEYGVEAGSDTQNGASAYYGFLLKDMTDAEGESLSQLADLLAHDASPWKQALKKALPQAAGDCYIEDGGPEPALIFTASGINAGDAEIVRRTADEAIRRVEENGFDREVAESVFTAAQMDALLLTESKSAGVDIIPNLVRLWATSGEIYAQDFFDMVAPPPAHLDNAGMTAAIAKHLRNARRTALAVTAPMAGLKEKQDQALKEELARVKANLSSEAIAALGAKSGQDGATQNDASAYVNDLRAVTIQELPESVRAYPVNERAGEDGVRRMDVSVPAGDVGQAMLLLSARGMAKEDLHWLKLYTDLIGRLATRSLSHEQVSAQMTRRLTRGAVRMILLRDRGAEGFTPYLQAAWVGRPGEMARAYELLEELLFQTRLEDAQAVSGQIDAIRVAFREAVGTNPGALLLSRAVAPGDPLSAADAFLSGLEYDAFLKSAQTMLRDKPEEALARLRAAQTFIDNRVGAVSAFAGTGEGAAEHRIAADAFFGKRGAQERGSAAYVFSASSQSEGVILDSAAQYNMLYADYATLGLSGYSGEMEAVTALVTDALLYPILRGQYGVYGVANFCNENGMAILSEQDPNVRETFEVYRKLPEMLSRIPMDQETLDGYILSAYSALATPEGALTGGMTAVLDRLEGRTDAQKNARMHALKTLTVQGLERYADVYRKLAEYGRALTAGGKAAIEQNAKLYEAVLNPFEDEGANP